MIVLADALVAELPSKFLTVCPFFAGTGRWVGVRAYVRDREQTNKQTNREEQGRGYSMPDTLYSIYVHNPH